MIKGKVKLDHRHLEFSQSNYMFILSINRKHLINMEMATCILE